MGDSYVDFVITQAFSVILFVLDHNPAKRNKFASSIRKMKAKIDFYVDMLPPEQPTPITKA